MSETVHYNYIGKLKLVNKLENETLEEQCQRILAYHNYLELEDYYDSWSEMLEDEFYKSYVIHNDSLYEIFDDGQIGTDYDIFTAHKNSDNTISYELMYYDVGCSFNEAIRYALDKME